VDDQDVPIGKRVWQEFYRSEFIHRGAHLLLSNTAGELLLQRRVASKKFYPDKYAFSVSCCVPFGETYGQAIEREMNEELGIQVPYEELFKYRFRDDYDNAFCMLYRSRHNGPFTLQKEEVAGVEWIDPGRLHRDIKRNPGRYAAPFIHGMELYSRRYDRG